MGPEEVGSGGTHRGGAPGGGPSSAKGLEVKKRKKRRVYKEQCGRRWAWKDWLAWHDPLRGLTGC